MNEYVTVGSTARAHSDNRNLKDDGRHTFVYDYKNRLIGAFDKATNNPVAAYLYYCDNRRAKKIVYSQTSPGVIERQERFFYDGNQVVEETDDAGNTLLTWVYSSVYVDEPVQYVRTSSHSLGAGTFYLHQNARADVVAVTDSAGSVVERRLYDDYGRSFDGTSKASVSGSAVGNVYGFQGRRLDPETGLYYFRARYYDPSTGRFVQRDPVWDPGNFGNQYSFVGNAPVSGQDPEGFQGSKRSGNKLTEDQRAYREVVNKEAIARNVDRNTVAQEHYQAWKRVVENPHLAGKKGPDRDKLIATVRATMKGLKKWWSNVVTVGAPGSPSYDKKAFKKEKFGNTKYRVIMPKANEGTGEAVARYLETTKGKISELRISGHGLSGRVGISYNMGQGRAIWDFFSDQISLKTAARIRAKLSKSAEVWLVGCDSGDRSDLLKTLANKLQRRVWGTWGGVTGTGIRTVGEQGHMAKWVYADPDPVKSPGKGKKGK